VTSAAGNTRLHSTSASAARSGRVYNRPSILIPVYNGQRTIGRLVDALVQTLGPHFERLEIVLVDDGSRDRSRDAALQAVARHPEIVRYIGLSRNFGEHNAVMCGLNHITGDCVVIMDDDFQNPPSEAKALIDKLEDGHDVVYSRYEKKKHSAFRNFGSRFNDWVAGRVLNKPVDLYLSSFKAMNAFLVKQVTQYAGPYPYLDGLVLQFTSKIGTQVVHHVEREEGQSNYNLVRLLRLWANMLTTCSVIPLRVASVIGLGMSLVGACLAVFFVVSYLTGGILSSRPFPPGWASLIVCVTVFAGMQLCVLGMIGEYLGRLYLMQNRLPQYAVRELISGEDVPHQRAA